MPEEQSYCIFTATPVLAKADQIEWRWSIRPSCLPKFWLSMIRKKETWVWFSRLGFLKNVLGKDMLSFVIGVNRIRTYWDKTEKDVLIYMGIFFGLNYILTLKYTAPRKHYQFMYVIPLNPHMLWSFTSCTSRWMQISNQTFYFIFHFGSPHNYLKVATNSALSRDDLLGKRKAPSGAETGTC